MFRRTRVLLPICATILFGVATSASHAQRPVVTKSVDEPGRVPYHQYLQGACTTSGPCRVAFKVVPSGFRLVVTHVSLAIDSATNILGFLSDDPAFDGVPASDGSSNAIVLAEGPRVVGSAVAVISSPVTFYVDVGKSPNVVLFGSAAPIYSSIEGYLVAID